MSLMPSCVYKTGTALGVLNRKSYRFTQVRRELTCDQGFRPVAIDLTALLSADQREM